jgi:hypothetical protein
MGKQRMSTQLLIGLTIVFIGSALLGAEYLLVNWYPGHQQRAVAETLNLLPYRNDALGIELQVAAGIYGKIDSFPNGVKIYRPRTWSVGPSLVITSQPNPDRTSEFSPEVLAKWQTEGVTRELPRYHFDHIKINNRDAVLIWQLENQSLSLTARVVSPERIIEAHCTPGQEDEALLAQACESSLRTLKVAGPEAPPAPSPGVQEIAPPAPGKPH